MSNEYGEFVGVDNLYYALHTEDSSSAFTMGNPEYLAPVGQIAGSPKVSNKPTHYENKPFNNYVTEGETELKVTVSNVPAEKAAILLGKYYDAATGRVFDSGEPHPPKIALGFRFSMGEDGYRYYWYLKGTFSGGTEEATSKSADVDVKTYELTFTALTTVYQWTVDGILQSMKRVFGDTSDAAFDETGWFTQVQTPTTAGAPAAVAMSSILPIDGEAAAAKASTIVITFNNEIASEAVSLTKDDGTIKALSKAWDVTKKILTLTPTTALAGTTTYLVCINGVTDVYGQILAAAVTDFTTVA